jgi:hypothetical protein
MFYDKEPDFVQIRCLIAQDNFKDEEKIKFKLGLNLQQGWKLPDTSVGDISGVSLYFSSLFVLDLTEITSNA